MAVLDSGASFIPNSSAANSAQQNGKYYNINLQSDAIEVVEDLFSRQLERAAGENSQINTPVAGDAEARAAFWLLLNLETQRSIFLNRCKNQKFWPRIRTLIGSPPFSFLNPTDDFVLNAGGITFKRIHMAPAEQGAILSAGEISDGHFVDEFGRVYKIVALEGQKTSSLSLYRNLQRGKRLIIDMRLPRLTIVDRVGIYKSTNNKSAIHFPKSGETVKLTINSKLFSSADSSEVLIVVKSIQPRGYKSPVCRVFCVVE